MLKGFFFLCFLILLLSSCASYPERADHARRLMEGGFYDEAASYVKEYAEKKDGDELLYWMDLGMIYHTAGKYEEAIRAFLTADKLAEIKDYTSISLEVASVVFNDNVNTYKGEHFENLLINVYLAIDYTLLGKWDDALVECRRVNQKLDKMIQVAKLPYQKNAFAKYLSAVLFESRNELNDAFVDYRQMKKWGFEYPYLPEPLMRVADRLKSMPELEKYKKEYPEVNHYRFNKDEGEVVLILEQGKSPVKYANPEFTTVPHFRKNYYASDYAWVRSEKDDSKIRSYPLYDIEDTAIRELDARAAAIIAKKIGGIAAKGAIATGIGLATNSEDLGKLAFIALLLTDRADLRHWTTLPARLHFARLRLPSGQHNIIVDIVGNGGRQLEVKRFENVVVKPGKQTFLNYRTKN